MSIMTTKKTCPELERWMSEREADQEQEYVRKSAVLEAVRNTGLHERYVVQEEVDRLLATGVLIHRDDAEGLAAAMGQAYPTKAHALALHLGGERLHPWEALGIEYAQLGMALAALAAERDCEWRDLRPVRPLVVGTSIYFEIEEKDR